MQGHGTIIRIWQRWVAVVSRPWIRAALGIILACDVVYVATVYGHGRNGRASSIAGTILSGGVRTWCVFPHETRFVRDSSGLHSVNLDKDSADEFARLVQEEPSRVFSVEWTSVRSWMGVWVPAIEPVEESLKITCFDGVTQATPAEAVEMRARHFAIQQTGVDPGSAGFSAPAVVALSKPDHQGLVVHWGAVGHNAVAAIVALGLTTSLIAFFRDRPERRRDRFLARGLCPTCKYDIDSIAIDAAGQRVCPECGSAWPADPPPKEGST